MIGFQTTGNATLICHDDKPILVTDPWLDGSAYFGSWALPYEISQDQRENIQACEFVWISHGHPDHLSLESLERLTDKKILVPDQVGSRVAQELRGLGFAVTVLEDAKWYPISSHIKIMNLCDMHQDAALFADINGRLVADLNDATPDGFFRKRFARKLVSGYPISFLLKKCTYRDADMINFFSEDGARIDPDIRDEYMVSIANFWCNLLGTRYLVPFSYFHFYQRTDSAWANRYLVAESFFTQAQEQIKTEVLPPFIRYDCVHDSLEQIALLPRERKLLPPERFDDDWNERLDADEKARLRAYFGRITTLQGLVDFISFKVGGEEIPITISENGFTRGITFETPRSSLMRAVDYRIFDDLLIGNFMRTTLHGQWRGVELYPYFSPWVPKYADNGGVYTRDDRNAYFASYRRRAPIDFMLHQLEHGVSSHVRPILEHHPRLFNAALKTYTTFKQI